MKETITVELSTRKDGALGSHTLRLPMTPDAFDTALCMAGVYTGAREEYEITGVWCAYPELERVARWAKELDELNFLAEHWAGFSQRDAENLLELATAMGGGILDVVGLTAHYEGIQFQPEIGSLEELGRQYLKEMDLTLADGASYAVNPVRELEYGKIVHKIQHGVFYGECPRYASLPLSLFSDPYNGHTLPYDPPEPRDCLRVSKNHPLIDFKRKHCYIKEDGRYPTFDTVQVETHIPLGASASQVCRTATRMGARSPFELRARYRNWADVGISPTIGGMSELAHQLRHLSEEAVSDVYRAIRNKGPEAGHGLQRVPELRLPDAVRADPRVELLLRSRENEALYTRLVLPQKDMAALDDAAQRLGMEDRHDQGYSVRSISLSPGSGVMDELLRSVRRQGEILSLDVLQEIYMEAVWERPGHEQGEQGVEALGAVR